MRYRLQLCYGRSRRTEEKPRMEPGLDMSMIYLMARGVIVQLGERLEYSNDLVLLNRCQETLVWLEGQAQQIEGYPGTKDMLRDWLQTVERMKTIAQGDPSQISEIYQERLRVLASRGELDW